MVGSRSDQEGRSGDHTPLFREYYNYSDFMYHDPPKMVSLTNLPENLTIHIVTSSSLKSRAPYNLGQVNKYFSILALPHIYCDVELPCVGVTRLGPLPISINHQQVS
jgi:hypothetical protein